jgi:hypothetical protein
VSSFLYLHRCAAGMLLKDFRAYEPVGFTLDSVWQSALPSPPFPATPDVAQSLHVVAVSALHRQRDATRDLPPLSVPPHPMEPGVSWHETDNKCVRGAALRISPHTSTFPSLPSPQLASPRLCLPLAFPSPLPSLPPAVALSPSILARPIICRGVMNCSRRVCVPCVAGARGTFVL